MDAEGGRNTILAKTMWARLSSYSDESFFLDFLYHGELFAPMRELVEDLAQRYFTDDLFGVTSMMTFFLTTAPSHEERAGHDNILIEYDAENRLFIVTYLQWVSSTKDPQRREVSRRRCEAGKVAETVDRYVLRLLLSSDR